eukprot:m.346172 g.346172  ORF g.346172 m.346172 type:complete len:317 (+) comp28276_c0_seq1:94-1044(+)
MLLTETQKGFLALGAVAVLWVTTSELVQNVEEEEHYEKPLFITLISLASFSSFLLRGIWDREWRENLSLVYKDIPWTAYSFALMWLLANICFYYSLETTSVASCTALSSSSSVFTLMGGFMMGTETPTVKKIVSVTAAVLGVVLITKADLDPANQGIEGHKDTMQGDAVAVLGAVLYAVYLNLFEKMVGDRYDTEAFLSFVGLAGISMMPLAWSEGFVAPTWRQLAILIGNGVFSTALGNRLWLYGSINCGPTAATLALTTCIPLAGVLDASRGKQEFTLSWVLGSGLVVLGFVLCTLNSDDSREQKSASKEEPVS